MNKNCICSLAWALVTMVIAISLFWAMAHSDSVDADKYKSCIKYHDPKICNY